MDTKLVVAILAIIFAPFLTFVVGWRKMSGKIGTTTADQLWEESRSIRADYARRITELSERIVELEKRNRELEATVERLHTEHQKDIEQIGKHDATITEMREIIEGMRILVDELRKEVGNRERENELLQERL